MLIILLQH